MEKLLSHHYVNDERLIVSLREDSVHRYEEAALAKSQSLF